MYKFFEWFVDRRYTIIGGAISTIGIVLIVAHCIFDAFGMDELFGNVLVNTVLAIGIAMYKYGQKKDRFRNYDGP